MSPVRVIFQPDGREIEVPKGTTIAEAARRAGIDLAMPCSGRGSCGRCHVLLPDRGSVLACQTRLAEATTVEIPIPVRSDAAAVHFDSTIPQPEQELERLDPLCPGTYGLAVDIGTSTLAAELVDLRTGRPAARAGKANAQAAFGAEVTRRIEYVEEHGVEALAEAVIGDLRELTLRMADSAAVPLREIGGAVVAGNPTMIHLLHRIDASPLRRVPHAPRVPSPPPIPADVLGLELGARAIVHSLPWIGGWVGGDICAGILATGMHLDDRLTLFIDVGTNGEIVLGNSRWMVACAASAGPAFEGCGIRDGTNARPGAIDRVRVNDDGTMRITTVGADPPIGICGTGLVSAIAELFRAGAIDRAGRIAPRWMADLDGEPGILLVEDAATAGGRAIGVAQRDIAAVLRAKAALFAGERTLVELMGLRFDAIERLILCGGFGSLLDPEDAVAIGMIPDVPRSRMAFAGNTALRGARRALLHRAAWTQAVRVARDATYIELNDQPGYFEEFSSANFLPHTDERLFPSLRRLTGGVR